MTLPAHPFFIALQFLTIFPLHLKDLPGEKAMGKSLLYYPLVGGLLGGLLSGLLWSATQVTGSSAAPLVAALLLCIWVLLTGGLHLDGLADSTDALMGGFGDRQRTLDIMKDPTSGPMGILSLILLLLVKFTALWLLVGGYNWQALVIAPLLGRTALIALFLTTPYVRPKGLGGQISNHMSQKQSAMVLFTALGFVALLAGTSVIGLVLVSGVMIFLLRALMMQRLGGTTGDTAGALVELTEAGALVTLALATS